MRGWSPEAHVGKGIEEGGQPALSLHGPHRWRWRALFCGGGANRLEGMVAKKVNSFYVSGRSREWLKMKTEAGSTATKERLETWHC